MSPYLIASLIELITLVIYVSVIQLVWNGYLVSHFHLHNISWLGAYILRMFVQLLVLEIKRTDRE